MSISYQAPEPKTLAQFFSRVGEALTQPATLRFRGGSAIRWLGSDLLTNDFDYDLTATDTAEVRAVMGRIAKEMRLDIEDWIFDEPAALPPGMDERSIAIGQYGLLEVVIMDPYTMALQKLERGAERDIKGVRYLVQNGYVNLDQLDVFAQQIRMDDRPQFQQSLNLVRGNAQQRGASHIQSRKWVWPLIIVLLIAVGLLLVILTR